MAATALRNNAAEAINRVAFTGERIALERHGKAVAALVSVADLAALEAWEDRVDLAAAKRALKEPGARPWAEVKAELGDNRGRQKAAVQRSGQTRRAAGVTKTRRR